jgi:hypothetical protein
VIDAAVVTAVVLVAVVTAVAFSEPFRKKVIGKQRVMLVISHMVFTV